jgi:hypothetical protein
MAYDDANYMGVACSLMYFMKFMFKDHYKDQMTRLMKKIIDDASQSPPEIPRDDDTTREVNLKKHMTLIRGLGKNSWCSLTRICVDPEEPAWGLIKDVLNMIYESQREIGNTDMLCMVTYVVDVCTELIKKSNRYDTDDEEEMVERRQLVNNVDKIVGMFADYILDRSMMSWQACRDFLFWLDSA